MFAIDTTPEFRAFKMARIRRLIDSARKATSPARKALLLGWAALTRLSTSFEDLTFREAISNGFSVERAKWEALHGEG